MFPKSDQTSDQNIAATEHILLHSFLVLVKEFLSPVPQKSVYPRVAPEGIAFFVLF